LPEAYIGGVDQILDGSGGVKDEGTRMFLKTIADAIAEWVNRFSL